MSTAMLMRILRKHFATVPAVRDQGVKAISQA
jgi:hypothetical protein